MKREVKFRGKRLDNGEWVVGHVHIIDTYGKGYTGMAIQVQHGTSRPFSVQVDPETVGQYTGLRDKNGKEIYEKDIIKDSFGDRIGMIKYNVYTASFEIAEYDGIHLLSADNGEKFFEVIGNVFEHPNLLQEETK